MRLWISTVRTSVRSLFCTVCILSLLSVASAQVMTSSNYQIESDSINFGGGYASSANYQLESTGGEVATGPSESSTYRLRAGYQQMLEVYIAMNTVADVSLSPTIPGLGGGGSTGSTSVWVVTDSRSGYQLSMRAEAAPAMNKGVDSIADYAPAGAIPDTWFTTGATDAHFGFSPFGPDVVQRYLESGGVCNQPAGSASSTACWDGASTTALLIAAATSANQPTGATTTIEFQVGVGSAAVLNPGDYYATTTLTAIAL